MGGSSVKLEVTAEVRKTEDAEKVKRAILNIFPGLELELKEDALRGVGSDVRLLSRFRELLRRQAILDAARSAMRAGASGDSVSFQLNKQAAFVGKVSFTNGESPMGPITVRIQAEDLERMIDYLAPRTKDGVPLYEIDYSLDP